jgi:hypothetical protein
MFRKTSEKVWESMEHLLPFISGGEIETLKLSGERPLDREHQEYVIVK